MIIHYQKAIGQSMNDVIDDIRKIYSVEKVTYAGRLDPMAYGLVIMLTDDDIHKRDNFTDKNKIYQFNMIKDIQTDTFDILGLINNIHNDIFDINKIILGKQIMEYPPYSSVPIKEYKKPYWYCSLNNLKVNNKPTKEIELFEIKILNKVEKSKDELIELITERINTLTKDTFRQKEILERWNTIDDKIYEIYQFEIKLSSGGYVRYFADKLGGCAYDINRLSYCDD
jgi:tRNA U55 pseudouridine synthase TruB